MVERGDAAPLLRWAEGPAVSPPQAPEPQAGGRGWGSGGGGRPETQIFLTLTPRGESWNEERLVVNGKNFFVILQGGAVELIHKNLAVTVRRGNMVEWCLPQDIDLEGVEFKSMASGSHKIQSDFIYFRKGPFLHQLETPGHYSHLAAFYEDKKGVLHAGPGRGGSLPPVYWLPSIHRYMYPEMKITHPAGCMSQFIKFFGEQILILWKFALLRKRILIFSPPPVGVVCYRVYCCCCLANVSLPGIGGAIPESKPFFYVNVADIESLEVEVSYVACTTEKIFEEKRELYDVYVDNQNVKTHHGHLQPLLRINSADREKYRRLNEQRQMLLYSQELEDDYTPCEEDLFVLFFLEQNNRIFQTLLEVSASQDKTLTAEHARGMGLDPQGDRSFLMDLLEAYGIDVMLVIDNPCCP
ncbi:protein LCHN [Puma concolor]|uniref:DENN domain-containing protein 11 n=1 Tax=Puma concolor TaxID=9696 RepID=A0A6P6IAD2_PUMCO|nr:protein LCHN [Puma concolor]